MSLEQVWEISKIGATGIGMITLIGIAFRTLTMGDTGSFAMVMSFISDMFTK